MTKSTKIIGISATVVILTGVSVAVARASAFGSVGGRISSFVFGGNAESESESACLKEALAQYRASLKEGRDAFVKSASDFRVGYKNAVAAAADNLRNVETNDRETRTEQKNNLKTTRKTALQLWSEKLKAARAAWQASQRESIDSYRVARENCLAE